MSRPSLLNLACFIPQRDVRRLIFRRLSAVDMQLVWLAHSKAKEAKVTVTEEGVEPLLQWDVLDYALEHNYKGLFEWAFGLGFSLTSYTFAVAALHGRLDALKWLKERDRHGDYQMLTYAVMGGHIETLHWVLKQARVQKISNACSIAAGCGHIEVLKVLRANGFGWNEHTCAHAASKGQLETLKYLRAQGCNWDASTCMEAAKNDHMDVLGWAAANGCPMNEDVCSYAAENGNLEMLRFARSNGCKWNSRALLNAARSGSVEMVQFMITEGMPWDKHVFTWAAVGGHINVIKWAKENGCPWCDQTIAYAEKYDFKEIVDWARRLQLQEDALFRI